MKKGYTVLLLALLQAAVLLSGCAYQLQSTPEQAEETAIKQTFLLQYVSAESIYTEKDLSVQYVGRFNGFDAVYVNGVLDYTQAEDSETVGGVTFRYSSGQHLLLYSHTDGRLYTLQQAFENKLLDKAGLRAVLEAHRAAEPWMYKEEPEGDEEQETVSVVPTEVTDEDILRAFAEKNPSLTEGYTLDDLSVIRIGVYDGCVAVWVNGPFDYNDAITTQRVDGLAFVYGSSHTIDLYRDGTLYKLPEAWEAGLLTRAALEDLHEALGGDRGETE